MPNHSSGHTADGPKLVGPECRNAEHGYRAAITQDPPLSDVSCQPGCSVRQCLTETGYICTPRRHRLRAPVFAVLPSREFVVANYAEMKKANPHFPILVRECAGTEAKLTARYGGCRLGHGVLQPAHSKAPALVGPYARCPAPRGITSTLTRAFACRLVVLNLRVLCAVSQDSASVSLWVPPDPGYVTCPCTESPPRSALAYLHADLHTNLAMQAASKRATH